jgi:hypothetical protein
MEGVETNRDDIHQDRGGQKQAHIALPDEKHRQPLGYDHDRAGNDPRYGAEGDERAEKPKEN